MLGHTDYLSSTPPPDVSVNSELIAIIEQAKQRLTAFEEIKGAKSTDDAPKEEEAPKQIRYLSPLTQAAYEMAEDSNDTRIRSAPETAERIHDFNNETIGVIASLADHLVLALQKLRIPIDHETLPRMLHKVIADFTPQERAADDPKHSGYLQAASMLTTQIGAELSEISMETASLADIRAAGEEFKAAVRACAKPDHLPPAPAGTCLEANADVLPALPTAELLAVQSISSLSSPP